MVSATVRRLTANDTTAITEIHLAAFPESAISALGSEATRRYYDWQLNGPHTVFPLGAEIGSELGGFCIGGVFRGALSGYVRMNRTFLAWQVISHPWLLARPVFRERLSLGSRIARTRGGAPSPPGREVVPANSQPPFGILSIAVDPRFQGVGIGKLLLVESERIARAQGFSQMHLTVNPSNLRAIHVYERAGWARVSRGDGWNGAMRKTID